MSHDSEAFSPKELSMGGYRAPALGPRFSLSGGERNRLFMTASQSLYAVYTDAIGAHMT